MSDRIERLDRGKQPTIVRTIEALLDYAIMEGAALRLPMFVFLLRAARLELTKHMKGGCD